MTIYKKSFGKQKFIFFKCNRISLLFTWKQHIFMITHLQNISCVWCSYDDSYLLFMYIAMVIDTNQKINLLSMLHCDIFSCLTGFWNSHWELRQDKSNFSLDSSWCAYKWKCFGYQNMVHKTQIYYLLICISISANWFSSSVQLYSILIDHIIFLIIIIVGLQSAECSLSFMFVYVVLFW